MLASLVAVACGCDSGSDRDTIVAGEPVGSASRDGLGRRLQRRARRRPREGRQRQRRRSRQRRREAGSERDAKRQRSTSRWPAAMPAAAARQGGGASGSDAKPASERSPAATRSGDATAGRQRDASDGGQRREGGEQRGLGRRRRRRRRTSPVKVAGRARRDQASAAAELGSRHRRGRHVLARRSRAAAATEGVRRFTTATTIRRRPTDREQYKKWLARSAARSTSTLDRQRGAAWYLEGIDGDGAPAFRYLVQLRRQAPDLRRLALQGSPSRTSSATSATRSIIQAKKICETLAL